MKKVLALLCAACMILSFTACGTSRNSNNAKVDRIVTNAQDQVITKWKQLYKDLDYETDGYFEIKNTRILFIKEDTDVKDFEDISYIVEFIIYSDYFGTSPYYINTTVYDSVSVYKDGTMTVNSSSPILYYRARTYSNDFSNIIDSITDCGSQYNTTKHFK